jgi:hypothetical protein
VRIGQLFSWELPQGNAAGSPETTVEHLQTHALALQSYLHPRSHHIRFHDRVLVSAVNSVQRQFLPNGLPLMDDSLMELPSTEKTTTESFGRLLG